MVTLFSQETSLAFIVEGVGHIWRHGLTGKSSDFMNIRPAKALSLARKAQNRV